MSRRQPRSVAAVLSGTHGRAGPHNSLNGPGRSPAASQVHRAPRGPNELSCRARAKDISLVCPSFHGTSAHERRRQSWLPSPPALGRDARVFTSRPSIFLSQSAQLTVCLVCNSSSRIFNGLPQRPQFIANDSVHSASGMQRRRQSCSQRATVRGTEPTSKPWNVTASEASRTAAEDVHWRTRL